MMALLTLMIFASHAKAVLCYRPMSSSGLKKRSCQQVSLKSLLTGVKPLPSPTTKILQQTVCSGGFLSATVQTQLPQVCIRE